MLGSLTMIENIDFYCTSHKNVDYLDDFKILTLIGCGEKEFSPKWKFFNNKSNINHKFVAYADLTAQYSIWKNIIKNDLKADKWISFSQYRRHWLNEKFNPNKQYKLNDLRNIVLQSPRENWKNFDAILTTPFVFKKRFFERIKNFNFNEKKSIKDQFLESIGDNSKNILFKILEKLPPKISYDFLEYMSQNNTLSAHGMYISKPNIFNEYFTLIFDWFEKCEDILGVSGEMKLGKQPRFFQYLNERFSDFWFKKNTKYTTNPICMYNEPLNKITLVGKII